MIEDLSLSTTLMRGIDWLRRLRRFRTSATLEEWPSALSPGSFTSPTRMFRAPAWSIASTFTTTRFFGIERSAPVSIGWRSIRTESCSTFQPGKAVRPTTSMSSTPTRVALFETCTSQIDRTTLNTRYLARDRLTLRSGRGSHWLTFDIKGDYGYVAPNKNSADGTEIFDARTHSSVGVIGSSEDMLEIDFADGKISRVGDQYGIGRR